MADIPGGLDLAAGAMSRAIGDIFRGRTEAIEAAPKAYADAEQLAGAQQQRAIQFSRLPAELARDRQQVQLGEFALERAPEELKQLKSLGGWQDYERAIAQTDRLSLTTAREKAREWARNAAADPNTSAAMKQFLNTATEDTIMAEMKRIVDSSEKHQQMMELEGVKQGGAQKLEFLKSGFAKELEALKEQFNIANPKSLETAVLPLLTPAQKVDYFKRSKIDPAEAHGYLWSMLPEILRLRAENAGAGKTSPEDKATREHVDREMKRINARISQVKEDKRLAALNGKTNPAHDAELMKLNAELSEQTSRLKGAPGADTAPITSRSWFGLPPR